MSEQYVVVFAQPWVTERDELGAVWFQAESTDDALRQARSLLPWVDEVFVIRGQEPVRASLRRHLRSV